jgi:hypothetical protein
MSSMDELGPGLKPDPEIEEWLRRQHEKRGTRWPGAPAMLDAYRGAIATLEQALRECPEDDWNSPIWEVKPSDPWMTPAPDSGAPARTPEEMQVFGSFWYIAFHCIFYLDFQLSQLDGRPYRSPKPFGGAEEHDVDEHKLAILPYRRYTRADLLSYLSRGAKKAEQVLGSVTIQQASSPCPPTSAYAGQPFSDLLRINLDHVREHGQQLRAALAR